MLALCRKLEEVCAALEGAVARWADTLARVEPVHLGKMPAAVERSAGAVEHARPVNCRAETRIVRRSCPGTSAANGNGAS